MKSQINLIRHGITEGNQRRLYYGAADIPLAEEGVERLKSLVEQEIYPSAGNSDFYTTGMKRTEQTFSLIYGETTHGVIKELREMSFGQFEMKSYEDLKEIPEYTKWAGDKTGTLESPGGESVAGFTERISGGLQILLKKHKKKEQSAADSNEPAAVTTVVCHGGTIATIMQECFPKEREHFYKWIPDPGHGYTLELEDGNIVSYCAF